MSKKPAVQTPTARASDSSNDTHERCVHRLGTLSLCLSVDFVWQIMMGLRKVPCIVLDGLSEKEQKEFILLTMNLWLVVSLSKDGSLSSVA